MSAYSVFNSSSDLGFTLNPTGQGFGPGIAGWGPTEAAGLFDFAGGLVDVIAGVPQKTERAEKAKQAAAEAALAQAYVNQQTALLMAQQRGAGAGLGFLTQKGPGGIPMWVLLAGGGVLVWYLAIRR